MSLLLILVIIVFLCGIWPVSAFLIRCIIKVAPQITEWSAVAKFALLMTTWGILSTAAYWIIKWVI